jgi:TonB-dependent receptor
MYNRNAEDEARVFTGWNDDRQKEWLDYRLRYVERSLLSNQLHGRHYFYQFLDSDLEWKATHAVVARNEPDNREVIYEAVGADSAGSTEWQLFVNNTQSGSRHFYELDESQSSGSVDWSVPFLSPAGLASKIKTGLSYESKDRDFLVRRFRFVKRVPSDIPWPPPAGFFIDLRQSPEDLFTPQYISADPSIDRFELTESTNYEDSYRATHDLLAGYASIDLFLNRWLRVVGGGRVERSQQELRLHNPLGLPYNPGVGDTLSSLDDTDLLPSLSVVLRTGEHGNVRVAYGRTLARPDFRELAPYEFVNYVGGYAEKGNPRLKRTLIDNVDLRLERFPGVGELIALSLFYKYFRNPIEQVIQPTAQLRVSYDNAQWARSYGVEFEFRKSLGFLAACLSNFSLNTNVALMNTEVKLPDKPDQIQTSKKRQLQGQSPYVVNAMLAYDNLNSGTSSTVLVHTFGRRISDVGGQGIPDTYEESRPQLDFVFKQRLVPRLTAKLSASNLLDPTYRWVQGGETRTEYSLGRSFSVGVSYSL